MPPSNGEQPDTASFATSAAATWYRETADEALRLLGSVRTGLDAREAASRGAVVGPNALAEPPPRSLAAMFAAQFMDLMILVLLAAALVSGVIGDITDTVVIVAIVLLNAVLGCLQEFRAERALAALKALAAPSATVLRNGLPRAIPATELVPGDVVALEAGRIVPADLRLIESASLQVNEAALTGESAPVDKQVEAIATAGEVPVAERASLAFMGTSVTYGRALGLVVATGMNTEFGRIAGLLTQVRALQTPLQRRLGAFGRRLALLVLFICAIVFATGLLRGEPPVLMFMTALSLAVAAIPEALPAVVSISLALGAHRMMASRALIRSLPAVETLGSVTFICADKTGTLTTNQMRAEQFHCDGTQSAGLGQTSPWKDLVEAMGVCHDAVIGDDGKPVGEPTEVALLLAARLAGLDPATATACAPRIAELPFDSTRKCMTTVHRRTDGTLVSFTKGAAEIVIGLSTGERRAGGSVPIDRPALTADADEMAAGGLRVLAIAMRELTTAPLRVAPDELERGLTFVGLIGLLDPPRPEARAAIETCRTAGIVPVMITGDHPLTARSVAARLGLLRPGDAVLSGPELAELSPEELRSRVRDIRVYARLVPEQKVDIVTALQATGEVVAMTGDGVNDAPALRQADIGVAMGLAGTDVARAASGIVLLDDNFSTVVQTVAEGRRIYDNLRRFIRYVLTTNSSEIWTIFLAPFIGLPVPLLPLQILWINLVTDGLPGLALALEPAEKDVMQRPPRPPTESLFARGLGAHALLVGLFMAALTLAIEAWYLDADPAAWQTAVFTTLCFVQLAHVLAIRSEETSLFTLGLWSNPPLLATVVLTFLVQLAIVYLPALNALFDTAPLRLAELGVCIVAAALVLLVVEAEKWLRRRARGKAG